MSALRVLMVTRRSWPQTGGSATLLADLAVGLVQRGVEVTLVTPRWQPTWPLRMELQGVQVVRLPYAPKKLWSTFQYLRALVRFLRENGDQFDMACVSELKHEARVVVAAGRMLGLSVVLRAEQSGLLGDCYWQLHARCGQRIKRECMRADALLAPTRQIEEELIAAGFPRDRISRCTSAVRTRPQRDAAARESARRTLGDIHAAFALPIGTPLALATFTEHHCASYDGLVRAWPTVAARWPGARLWLAGDGPDRVPVARLVEQLGLAGQVAFPGRFEDPAELLAAADTFVWPTTQICPSILLTAMGMGLPMVAVDSPPLSDFVTHGQEAVLASGPETIGNAINELWSQPQRAAELGRKARERASAEFSLERAVDEHFALFERLSARRAQQVPA